jgi:hypothetical protein
VWCPDSFVTLLSEFTTFCRHLKYQMFVHRYSLLSIRFVWQARHTEKRDNAKKLMGHDIGHDDNTISAKLPSGDAEYMPSDAT